MVDYTANVTRDTDRFWLIHIVELDQWTQARTVSEIEPMARDLIAVVTGVVADEVALAVDITLPAQAAGRLAHATRLREQEAAARREAADEVRAAALDLQDAGISLRDIGRLLGVSHQRAGQLTKKETAQPGTVKSGDRTIRTRKPAIDGEGQSVPYRGRRTSGRRGVS